MTMLRAFLFATLFGLPIAGIAAPDEKTAECRAAASRDEPAPHDARERDPREAAADAQERRDDAADCAASGWRSRIPGMLR